MTVLVPEWRPLDACHLQRALRLTNEAFAEKLGLAPRTIAKWHANPTMGLTLETQQVLDTMLSRSGVDEQRRFEFFLNENEQRGLESEQRSEWPRKMEAATDLACALDWLDGIHNQPPGTSARQVANLLHEGGEAAVRERGRSRGQLGRELVAQTVRDYYGDPPADFGTVTLSTSQASVTTTLLTTETWLAECGDLRREHHAFAVAHDSPPPQVQPDQALLAAAIDRAAEVVVGGTRFMDAFVYRLLDVRECEAGLGARFAVDGFGRYALTWDLLEAEALDFVLGDRRDLSLRDHLLPSTSHVLNPAGRLCIGGAQGLCAFARPSQGGRPPDYLLLVQERSPHVVNTAGRLAVIPKCFHQPINDIAGEVAIGATLHRELEEELFGRDELEGAVGRALADPMHVSRLTEPMRWLVDSPEWDMLQTGFAYNLVSGNYEFAAVIAVHDERFWERFGGMIEANWEAAGLRRCSTQDPAGLSALMADPSWSDEGLVALGLGLKRLAELDPSRVTLPPFEIGVTS